MDGDQFGPYSATQIKELDLLPDVMVRQESSKYWQRADSYNFNSLANDEFVESLNIRGRDMTCVDGRSSHISLQTSNGSMSSNAIEMPIGSANGQYSANENLLIPCPECGRLSDSLKCFVLPRYAVFVGVYAQWQNVQYICCPSCMRKHIGIKCFTYNIILANLMWPVIILPWGVTQLVRSCQHGHTKTVKEIFYGCRDSSSLISANIGTSSAIR